MSPSLVPCPSCARHLRSAEIACPFCGAGVRAGRLSRAALLLAGATALAGCGKEPATADPPKPTPTDNGRMMAPAYGGPPPSFLPDGATTTTTPVPVPPSTDAGAKK